jgi:hypothetical protein
MNGTLRRMVGYLGAVALTAIGCATSQREQSANPTAQAVQSQQRQSQEALNRANEAQKRASEQQKKATRAQEDVQRAQQALIQAQQNARREQAKAEQLQHEAQAISSQAAQQAAQSQREAAQSQTQLGRQVEQGQITMAGEVVAASGDQLVLQPRSGEQPMTFRVTNQTNVRIDGQQASLAELQQGEDARVSYQASGSTQPEALSIDVTKTGAAPPAPGAAPSQSAPPR